jgi:hypothetical protein
MDESLPGLKLVPDLTVDVDPTPSLFFPYSVLHGSNPLVAPNHRTFAGISPRTLHRFKMGEESVGNGESLKDMKAAGSSTFPPWQSLATRAG